MELYSKLGLVDLAKSSRCGLSSLNKLSSLVLWSLNKHLVKRAGGLRRNHRSSLFSDTVC